MNDLIPYYIDNVRIRYSGKIILEGYALWSWYQIVRWICSRWDLWISVSYARAKENIDGRGYIARPTDQRFRFSMFYPGLHAEIPKYD